MPSADRKHRRSPRSQQQRLLPQQHHNHDSDELALDGASFAGAVFNLSTTIVGAGIMALPAAVKQLGMVPGLIAIMLGAIITDASIEMIMRFSRASKAASYSGLVADAFGGVGRTLLQGCIVVNNIGTLVVYMIIIAQVHRATLHDGQEVVVKVQHQGVKTIILEDLKNAKAIVDWIAWAEPHYDFSPMIDEWCKEAPKELDFNHEAENTRTVFRNLGCKGNRNDRNPANCVDVLIPEVIQSTERLLILEYMDGIRLNDTESLEAVGVDKQKLVEEITRAYAHQIYVDGFFNGDPHPGNFLVSKQAPHRPILLDFGLTKLISTPMKQALAKMFLASAEGDHVALLSAFEEMGLKLRLDMPEQAMEVTSVFFRNSTPSAEARENVKSMAEQRTKNMKALQDKMKLNQKEVTRFNPVDAFPGDIVIFTRVLNLLRGLSSTMNVRIVYLDIMRPFAESVLDGNISKGPALNAQWINDSPVHSDVEAKLRQLLVELGDADKILGIQVCAYKDGEVIVDTSAGMLGRYDPRPVQPDSLFPVFSVTKGITAGMLHWLVDTGKLKLDENVGSVWPQFRVNGKDQIKVHHVLNHTSGMHNALASLTQENPFLMLDWEECLNRIATSVPETEPGREQLYHYVSFGWLCGGIIEFQEPPEGGPLLDRIKLLGGISHTYQL